MRLRHLLIRVVTPLVWRMSERRKLAALQEFSDTELDSGWQSLYTLARVDDPKTKAELFSHTLDEFYHAEMFANLMNHFAKAPVNRPAIARESILGGGGDKAAVLDFLAQVYVGESEINRDFKVYAKSGVDEQIRALFERVMCDEEGHEEVSWELMLRYADGSGSKLRLLILKKKLQHMWKRYVKVTQTIGDFWMSVMLSVIYLVGGLFVALPLRRRLELDRGAQLEILREQLGAVPAPRAEPASSAVRRSS